MAAPHLQVPYDVLKYLTDFSTDFDAAFALGPVDDWASQVGAVRVSDSIKTTLPIPLSAAGYKLRDGNDKMRRLFERSLSMTTLEWTDGVYENAKIVEQAGDAIGWSKEPANIAFEALRHTNVLAADVLASNPLLDFYRIERPGGSAASTLNLFHASHPFNVLDTSVGTFDNDWAAGNTAGGETVPATINSVLIKALRRYFRSIKGPNGRPLGLRFGGLLVTADHEEEALDAFARDAVLEKLAGGDTAAAAMPNRFASTRVIVADELTGTLPSGTVADADKIYAFATRDGGGSAPVPFVVQRGTSAEEIVYDRDSDYYKNTGNVGLKYVMQAGAAACLPHAIVRINLTP